MKSITWTCTTVCELISLDENTRHIIVIGFILRSINHCRLFNVKYYLYIRIKFIFVNRFCRKHFLKEPELLFVQSQIVSQIKWSSSFNSNNSI